MSQLTAWLAVALSVCVAVALSASSASADGYCGNDQVGAKACPIDGSAVYTGSLTPASDPYPFYPERDYFVFAAKAATRLQITIADTENPADCAIPGLICGDVSAELLDGRGNQVASSRGSADIINGIAVPATLTRKLTKAGTYYLVFSGPLSVNVRGGPTSTYIPVPYSVTVSATPNVFWPAQCTVPRVHHHEGLTAAERALRRNGCEIGRIVRQRSRTTPAADVLAFEPGPGQVLAHGTRVRIVAARA